MEISERNLTAEEFDKAWKEAQAFMKDYKIVLLVCDNVCSI